MNERATKQVTTALIAGGIGVGLIFVLTRYRRNIRSTVSRFMYARGSFLRQKQVVIVTTPEDCRAVIERVKIDCQKYPVLGFDTEWVTLNGNRQPIALLQLSTAKGLCALLRLCCLRHIPRELRDVLEDEDILKVGVAPQEDAKFLSRDYGVGVASTLDLRYMALEARVKPEGLGGMSKAQLGIELDKDWRIRCSDWEAAELTPRQVDYAAMDAFVGVELFKKFAKLMKPSDMKHVMDVCGRYLEIQYKNMHFITTSSSSSVSLSKSSKGGPNKEFKRYKSSTLSRRMYDNIQMYSPDGELLCTCDKTKAEWYVTKNLASVITEEPYSIQLNFEPAGRPVGDVGKYYTIPKENRCVVCGEDQSLIRKNVVPRDYRKHFTNVMKDSCSHDILLLCLKCHQLSNMSDLNMRHKLTEMCDAPLQDGPNTKFLEVDTWKRLKSASRALLYNGHMIPEDRKKKLENEILEHLPDVTEVNDQLLQEYAEINIYKENESYIAHGKKVVEHFITGPGGGLVQLERIWREHFLQVMKPKYLPELWSVDHNVQRLEIRADEGRINVSDLVAAGLAPELLNTQSSSKDRSYSSSNSTLVDASTLRDLEMQTEYVTARSLRSDDEATDASLSSFKSIDDTLKSFHPDGETVYESDDSDSTLTQPSSNLDMDSD